jgi:hypothetical protein
MRVNCGPCWQDVGMKRQLVMYVWNFEVECFKSREVLDIKLFHGRMQGVCYYLKGPRFINHLRHVCFKLYYNVPKKFRAVLLQRFENMKCDKTEQNIEIREELSACFS